MQVPCDSSDEELSAEMDPQVDPFTFWEQRAATKGGKPRSAFDESAEWYCGDDDVDHDSIHSDGSSVLSAFRRNKTKQSYDCFVNEDDGTPEVSMNVFDLVIGNGDGDDGNGEDPSSSLSVSQPRANRRKKKSGSNARMSDDSFVALTGSRPSTVSQEFLSLESIPVSQLLVSEKKNPRDDVDSAAILNIEDTERGTDMQDNTNDDIIGIEIENDDGKESLFLDRMATTKYIRIMAICSSMLFVLDVVLLCLFLK
eukprot:jgi/Psemu1/321878/estExt_fgenesh1_pg.C_120042